MSESIEKPEYLDFIREAVAEDLRIGRCKEVRTRFPPEPNGWLHIGHAKALFVDFGVAQDFGGKCNLRMDDTNPEKEDMEYVEAIKRDIKWLGFDWEDRLFFASDYYERLFELACKLINKGLAYVDDLDEEQIKEYRGTNVPDKNNITFTPPGRNSPWRDRSPKENLDLFERMRAGEFPDGSKTLRAKIDMAHPNLLMRDPVMYRIRRIPHYRTGTRWCIYPMYDFAHPLSDAIEGITHSLCSLEYEIHRPLYEWFIQNCEVFPSRQIEFARLNLSHTVLSKRWLLQLVRGKKVKGWDDPRMPTIAGMRRRGYPAAGIRDFLGRIGIAKTDSLVDIQLLEHCIREELNAHANRYMAVMNPVKLVIENWPKGKIEWLEAINNPEDPSAGIRKIPFSGTLYIDREDFKETPPPKYYRLYPGNQVRLRYGYVVTCTGFEKDPISGEIERIRCVYDPNTRGGDAPDNRKVKGTIQWVCAMHAVPIEARLYDHLFDAERPMEVPEGKTFFDNLSDHSLIIESRAVAEPAIAEIGKGETVQFERIGYFCKDLESTSDLAIFNRTVTLKDTWAKIEKKLQRNP
ncbi:MAG TPA: glutamine--tRNA ligase/YqeY domain fusion protein [Rectinema sp.]|jgi:glutaminyl-tRNA synthetase|nr:glutamine--tRNA ligase/YqeY domain fusion protein [Spirochaetia bacterium]MDI9427850.1 glutamine--tRNA ligase/YqeY domain fusion protein [Spirochaetota bacterium]OQC74691.1 MAG: Glutamine--tRNA ligase [Spirochaetes bacterium ADurb.Bin001]HNP92289.1 glutamine--tRNA ligase/YqeY domain fusion protein [Rectinema sp.]HNT58573.1 glutamine--tRNA ligase/YqeY domain fusion protein [Rectinema sp.]